LRAAGERKPFRVGDGLDRLFGAAADNVFLVKFSYWWRP
jgi:hypothetical protein